MLSLSGNSESAFASKDSINMVPTVYAEWNYNVMNRPYLVVPTASGAISTASTLNTAANWSTQSGSGAVLVTTSGGYTTPVSPNGAAMLMIPPAKRYQETFSSSVSVSSGYYKLVFYVKSNMNPAALAPTPIAAATVTPTVSGSGTQYYYRVAPVPGSGRAPFVDQDGLDIIAVNANASVTLKFPYDKNVVAYNVYRGTSSANNLPFLEAFLPGSSAVVGGQVTYQDVVTQNIPTSYFPPAKTNMKVMFTPTVRLASGGTYLERPSFFAKFFIDDTSDPDGLQGSQELDGVTSYKVELYFGADTAFDTAWFDLSFVSVFTGAGIVVNKFELYKIDSWNYYNWKYFPLESSFTGPRPGEALLHPLLPSTDATTLKTSNLTPKPKPVSNLFYNFDWFAPRFGQPYKQGFASVNNKFKYYISDSMGSASTSVRAQYNNLMSINKVVLKVSNAVMDMTTAAGQIQVLGPSSAVIATIPFSAGAINSNGILTCYYNGATWSTSRGSWVPPTLTDSGMLQNVTASVTGLALTIGGASYSPFLISAFDNNAIDRSVNRLSLIELSPRLELDVSPLTVSADFTFTMDDSTSIASFPIGYMNANMGTLTLDNAPVLKNEFAHTMFDSLAAGATFSDLLREGIKFTGFYTSPVGTFTDSIPAFTAYSDLWKFNDLDNASIDLFDQAKYNFMSLDAPDYFGVGDGIFATITNILDAVGFSDYDYDGLKTILSRRAKNTTYFWCDKKQSIFDILKQFCVSHQIGASFDQYGILRFVDLDAIVGGYISNKFVPDLAITDVATNIVKSSGTFRYEPNILMGGYTPVTDKKVGKVSIDYKTPMPQTSFDKYKTYGINTKVEAEVFKETSTVAIANTFVNKPVKWNDRTFSTDPKITWNTPTVNTLGGYSGTGFLGGELVSWEGLEFKLTSYYNQYLPYSTAQSKNAVSTTAVAFSQGDLQAIIDDIYSNSASVSSVTTEFTGKVVGIQRGLRHTSVRNHNMYDDGGVGGMSKPTSNFKEVNMTSRDSITFIKNVAHLTSNPAKTGTNKPIIIVPTKNNTNGEHHIPTSASNFNYFSFIFKTPNLGASKQTHNKDLMEVGSYISYGGPAGALYIGLRAHTDHTGKVRTYLVINENSTKSVGPYTSKVNVNPTVGINSNTGVILRETRPVFNGNGHRFAIHIDDKFNMLWAFVDNVPYGPFYYNGAQFKAIDWGFYSQTRSRSYTRLANDENSFTSQLNEMYAYQTPVYSTDGGWVRGQALAEFAVQKNNYHWNNHTFLNKLLLGDPTAEPAYYYWGSGTSHVRLWGAQIYSNAEFTTSPVKEATVSINYIGYNPGNVYGGATLKPVHPVDVSFSRILSSPFRMSLIAVNNSNQLIYLAEQSNKVNNGDIKNLTLVGEFAKMSDTKTLEKIINPANVGHAVTLQSDWIQSSSDARDLLDKVTYMANPFTTELDVDIFGNPLIQIGDIVQVIYTLKNVGYDPDNGGVTPAYFLVKEVHQSFTSGLATSLKLRPLFTVKSANIS